MTATSLGPWTTSLDSGWRMALNAFWRRRMSALPRLNRTPARHRSARLTALIFAGGIAVLPLVELGMAAPQVEEETEPSDADVARLYNRAEPANPEEQRKIDALNAKRRTLARQLFQGSEQYSLEPNELVRFIPAKEGGEVRRDFENAYRTDERPINFLLHFRDGVAQEAAWHYGEQTLAGSLDAVFGIKLHRIEADLRLLAMKMPHGDWLLAYDPRKKPPVTEELVSAIAKTLSDVLDEPIAMEWRKENRPVLVARGDYQFTPIPGEEGKIVALSEKVAQRADGDFFFPARRGETVGSVGGFSELLEDVGELLLMPIVDEIGVRPTKESYFWRFPRKPHVTLREPLDERTAAEVRAAFTKQTGLELVDDTRMVNVLIIEVDGAVGYRAKRIGNSLLVERDKSSRDGVEPGVQFLIEPRFLPKYRDPSR